MRIQPHASEMPIGFLFATRCPISCVAGACILVLRCALQPLQMVVRHYGAWTLLFMWLWVLQEPRHQEDDEVVVVGY